MPCAVECERERRLFAASAARRQAAWRHTVRPSAKEERGQDEASVAEETMRRTGGGLPRYLPRRREQAAHPGEPIDLPDQISTGRQARLRSHKL